MNVIYRNGTAEITIKKSRFLSVASSIRDTADAEEQLAARRKQMWNARHHCFAYILNGTPQIQRFSDDGEPASTAGKPILDVLSQSGLTNAMIIVTRYFGGTLLGTGGLVRAYQEAAQECLHDSAIAPVVQGIHFRVRLAYTVSGQFNYLCGEKRVRILSIDYGDSVVVECLTEEDDYEAFQAAANDLLAGKFRPIEIKKEQYLEKEDRSIIYLS